jgi:hypothetical protein
MGNLQSKKDCFLYLFRREKILPKDFDSMNLSQKDSMNEH